MWHCTKLEYLQYCSSEPWENDPILPVNDWLLCVSVIFGEDVAFGGVFRCTVGLRDKYGERPVAPGFPHSKRRLSLLTCWSACFLRAHHWVAAEDQTSWPRLLLHSVITVHPEDPGDPLTHMCPSQQQSLTVWYSEPADPVSSHRVWNHCLKSMLKYSICTVSYIQCTYSNVIAGIFHIDSLGGCIRMGKEDMSALRLEPFFAVLMLLLRIWGVVHCCHLYCLVKVKSAALQRLEPDAALSATRSVFPAGNTCCRFSNWCICQLTRRDKWYCERFRHAWGNFPNSIALT